MKKTIIPDTLTPNTLSFVRALIFWLKFGFISFGGPAGQISIMHQELVEKKRWISEKRFLHALNYCMMLPGPEAQQLATYIGWLMHRTLGGVVAGILFVLPSLVLLIVLSWIHIKFQHFLLVSGLFYGIKPAVTAIVLHAAYRIGSRALHNTFLKLIALAAFISIFFLKISFPIIVLVAALTGLIGGNLTARKFQSPGSHQAAADSDESSLIDDDTPTPGHALFSWKNFAFTLGCGIVLWFLPMAILVYTCGWDHTLTQMAWFFTKAALLTFGGAYAVLPYVYQGAVIHYAWLSPSQMIDGLALGETTPGPLIMVVTYVAFIGAYSNSIFGESHMLFAGVVAAVLITWFTFLPSFIFILAGGPLVESTHGKIKFTSPLAAITAAVVGVILNLALFFCYHVLWPSGTAGRVDWIAAVLTILASVAIFKGKISVIKLIVLSGCVGLMIKLSDVYLIHLS